jgi:hypothetical protein
MFELFSKMGYFMKLHVFLVLPVLFLSACSEVNKLGKMQDSTVSMEKTTKEMNTTTSQMKDRTESLEAQTVELKKLTDELYNALRQGDALNSRRQAFDLLLKEPSTYKKISEAGKYFMSFEVQLWNDNGQDKGGVRRDILAQQAAQEFFMEIESLAPRDGSVDPTQEGDSLDVYSESNRSASFNALAMAMHLTNRKQDDILKRDESLKKISMYSILEDALLSRAGNTALSGANREVLLHEKRAIQLLQARYNTFQLIFVDLISGISDQSNINKIRMLLFGWNADISTLSVTKANYLVTEVLFHAFEAQKLLGKIGQNTELNPKLRRLLHSMNIIGTREKASTLSASHLELFKMIEKVSQQARGKTATY